MAKRYTKNELAGMSAKEKIRAYNAMAGEEGAATQQRGAGAALPTDLEDRLSSPAYKFTRPDSSIPLLRGATRSVSSEEIKTANNRMGRLGKWAKANPGKTLPVDWDKDATGKAKGGSIRHAAKGGAVKKYARGGSVKPSASKRGDGIAQRGKTKGKMR
jgi:hypothetical protein